MKSFNWRSYLPDCLILGVFILASVIYFWPAMCGKFIYSVDSMNPRYSSHACVEYHEETGEYSYWSEAMFSGMPNYHLGGNGGYLIDKILRPLRYIFSYGSRNTAFIFLFYLIAFFLLLRTFKIDKWVSVAGAFAIAMSSYFFVIISASHISKTYTITWMMMVIIGFLLIFRKEYGWGSIMTMFFTYIGFFAHPQMSYYICMMLGVFALTELYIKGKEGAWRDYLIAALIFVGSFGIGFGMGSSNIFVNVEYAEQTMRGGHSDLVKETDSENKTAGLDLDYATAWSYGIDETMTLLIPNFMGGASGYKLDKKSDLYKDLVRRGVPSATARDFCSSAPTYRGEKAFTSGPVYVGAVVIFLFILGLLIVRNPYKWALLISTLFSVLLSWGRHFMPLTRFFYDYFPVYNKFRAVESILIVAEIAIPILAFLAVQELIENRNNASRRSFYQRSINLAFGIVGGTCLLFALFGSSLCHFESTYDNSLIKQVGKDIYQFVLDQRAGMLTSDAWRSFLFVVLSFIITTFYVKRPFKEMYLGLAFTIMVIADMWPVDKRFCNDNIFVSKKIIDRDMKKLPYEEQLLATDNSVFRVLNLTANTFNDSRTSCYLNSVGGYSAVKLRRYQDLIDEHISKMNISVLNMLNTKYIITKDANGGTIPRLNPEAFGPCWLVDSVFLVSNANDESDALKTLDIKHIAVLDTCFKANQNFSIANFNREKNSEDDSIILSYFGQNRLQYESNCLNNRLAVFSEIYYPYGWKATIDDEETPILRVNYTLRAIEIPKGSHTIKFHFDPESVKKGNRLALAFFFLMILTTIGILYKKYVASKHKPVIADPLS